MMMMMVISKCQSELRVVRVGDELQWSKCKAFCRAILDKSGVEMATIINSYD